MPTLNLKIIPVPPAIFLGDFADLNSFRGINPDAPPKEGLEASEGHIEGHEGRPSKRGASWSLWYQIVPLILLIIFIYLFMGLR